MLAIASVTFPFFALVGIGYLAARLRLLPPEAVPGLNTFVLYFALTSMLFQLGRQTPVATLLDPVVLGLWLVAGLVVVTLGVLPPRRRGAGWLDAAFGGLVAALSNSGFMGLPLIITLVPPPVGRSAPPCSSTSSSSSPSSSCSPVGTTPGTPPWEPSWSPRCAGSRPTRCPGPSSWVRSGACWA